MGNERIPFKPSSIYHVFHHGNAEDNIFISSENYRYFLEKYKQYIIPIADTYAYTLMPNHFHFALKIKKEDELKSAFARKAGIKKYADISYTTDELSYQKTLISDESLSKLISTQFGHFLNAYSKAYNKRYDRIGSLFRENIERRQVTDGDYFRYLIRYIHLNGVKHFFVKNPFDWPYSSIHAFKSEQPSLLLRNDVFDYFDSKECFWDFHDRRDMDLDSFFE